MARAVRGATRAPLVTIWFHSGWTLAARCRLAGQQRLGPYL